MREQWPRALLRAALREAGYDAVGARSLSSALRFAEPEAGRGAVGLIVLGQEALAPADRQNLEPLQRATHAPVLLVASAGNPVEEGPWLQVLRRPVSIGELVRAVERVLPLPAEDRHPID